MRTLRTSAAALLTAAAAATALIWAPAFASTTAYAVNGSQVSRPLDAAINALSVAAETPAGYVRSAFTTWTDANHNCRDTRAEVLVQESHAPTTGGCTIKTGRWLDWYDGVVYTKARQLDIDHLVPLEEVWSSGAKTWSSSRREAYANDLADRRTLVATSLHTNRSKGDQEPDQWMPIKNPCRYIAAWVAVKTRWALSIDPAEKAGLLGMVSYCGNPTVSTHLAVVRGAAAASQPGITSSSQQPQTFAGTSGSTGSPTSSLDPRFPTCTAAKAAGYGPYYKGVDPEYYWYRDADGDGIDCE